MPLAKINVTVPEDLWIARLSASYPEVVLRVVSTQYDAGIATALLEIHGENIVQIIAQANEEEDIRELDLLWKNETKTIVQIETENALLLRPVSRVGIPLQTPFVISDGVASWEILTSHSKLSRLSEELDGAGMAYDVKSVQDFNDGHEETVLTERQEEVLLTAFESGYYDTPREASLTVVAESLNITKSTCSDILHRAEGKIIEQYLNRYHQS
ncbi:helix-turn-helix domain-containing protein [Halobellus marinus]|uniref:helix-turn-helix domain-containing protein n=1 Tax=Halobellus TaxID=1073986 RepID=UPI0028AD27B1|nr:helix-turn-helix domain-containing protein [Halobellus sp. DFY28]